MQLDVQYADEEEPPSRGEVLRVLRAALDGPARITVRFVGTEEGAALNERYRGRSGPTNVLAFGYGADGDGRICGDIVLCSPLVRSEANRAGTPAAHHYAHLIAHGALHLQGYGHETRAEAERMEARETGILAKVGVPSPWEGEE